MDLHPFYPSYMPTNLKKIKKEYFFLQNVKEKTFFWFLLIERIRKVKTFR